MMQNPIFMQLLASKEILTPDAGNRLLQAHGGDAFSVLCHLVKVNPHKRVALARLWGDSMGVSYVDTSKTLFQRGVLLKLPEEFARKHHIVLLYEFGEAVTAAMADPTNQAVLREAQRIVERSISPVFSLPEDIETAIEIEYQSEDQLNALSSKIVTESVVICDITDLTRDELQSVAGNQGVVEFVKGLLLLAVKQRASDIHVEPGEEKVRIRFRIDGVLQEKSKLEKSLLAPVISRLKILANLDITERRKPQDGRMSLTLPSRTVDLRFSSIPTIYGEKAVLRVLGDSKAKDVPDLSELSFSSSIMKGIRKIVDTPYGIFFVTGPTGSGKTTTLFSMLKHLNKPGKNITTIEDPIEYRLSGVNQVQLNSAVELDFPAALRSFLRQDPDVILIGEIRDTETAEIACRAALTGHLVLATLHANTALQATTRLMDMGVQPEIVAPSVVGITSQRLVRKICDNCKEKYFLPAEDARRIIIWDGTEVPFYRGKGCDQCNHSGYSGRIGIHEMILVNDEIRRGLVSGAPLTEIHKSAAAAGYRTMRHDGIKKVLRGLTTLEEIDRVTIAEEELEN